MCDENKYYIKFKGKSYKIKLQLVENQNFILIRCNNILYVKSLTVDEDDGMDQD